MSSAVSLAGAIVGLMMVYTFAMYVIKQYAEKNRLEFKTSHAIVLDTVEDDKCRERIQHEQKYFLKRFERYTSETILGLYKLAYFISFWCGLSFIATPAWNILLHRDTWSSQNYSTTLFPSGILLLGYCAYNYLKYRQQLKKLSE